jgi:hypothetical protein
VQVAQGLDLTEVFSQNASASVVRTELGSFFVGFVDFLDLLSRLRPQTLASQGVQQNGFGSHVLHFADWVFLLLGLPIQLGNSGPRLGVFLGLGSDLLQQIFALLVQLQLTLRPISRCLPALVVKGCEARQGDVLGRGQVGQRHCFLQLRLVLLLLQDFHYFELLLVQDVALRYLSCLARVGTYASRRGSCFFGWFLLPELGLGGGLGQSEGGRALLLFGLLQVEQNLLDLFGELELSEGLGRESHLVLQLLLRHRLPRVLAGVAEHADLVGLDLHQLLAFEEIHARFARLVGGQSSWVQVLRLGLLASLFERPSQFPVALQLLRSMVQLVLGVNRLLVRRT